jgi:hypothetical protein
MEINTSESVGVNKGERFRMSERKIKSRELARAGDVYRVPRLQFYRSALDCLIAIVVAIFFFFFCFLFMLFFSSIIMIMMH